MFGQQQSSGARWALRWPLAYLAIAVQATTLSSQTATPEPRLRSEFAGICDRSRSSENPFYSNRTLHRLQERIDALEKTRAAPDADLAIPAIAEGELRGRLAFEYLRTGSFEEARDQAATALVRLDRDGLRVPGLWAYLKEVEASAIYQSAEDQNCLALGDGASCLLPVGPDAVHEMPDFARSARDHFLELLARNPNRVSARWLANLSNLLAGDEVDRIPSAMRLPPGAFEPPDGTTFVPWTNIGPRVLPTSPDLAGGAVMDDFDGDGHLDLISSSMDPCAPLVALRRTADGGFERASSTWGLDAQLGGLNLIHADFDDDGRLDLFVLRGAWFGTEGRTRNSLLLNRSGPTGEPRFEDVTAAVGLAHPAYPTQSAAAGDFDGDGDLDLVIANEAADIVIDPSQASNQVRSGFPLQLFRNELRSTTVQTAEPDSARHHKGPLRFTDIASASGLDDRSFSKGVAWGDVDNDGDLDLHVSNFGPNRLYLNLGPGAFPRFREAAAMAGVRGGDRRTFATWFFDFDQDGDLDLFAASYNVPSEVIAGNLLGLHLTAPDWSGRPDRLRSNPLVFRNESTPEGGVRFLPVSEELGLDFPVLAMGANYADLDNDGDPDIVLGTGMPDITAVHPNVVLRNEAGARFTDVTFASGMAHLQKGHGVAFGDVDRDGDLDLFHQLGGAFPYDRFSNALFLNPTRDATVTKPTGEEPGFLSLRLQGVADNHYGLGARLSIVVREGGQTRTVYAQVGTGGSFGGSSLETLVGLGSADAVERVVVRWPSGQTQTVTGFETGGTYELRQGHDTARRIDVARLPLRGAVTSAAGSTHDEDLGHEGRHGPEVH